MFLLISFPFVLDENGCRLEWADKPNISLYV